MPEPLSDDVAALFQGPNYAHLATLMPDGSPHSVTVWMDLLEDGRLAFFTGEGSQKARNVRRDPRCAVSIAGFENPFRTARIRGRLADLLEGEEANAIVDRLSRKYTGSDFPIRDRHVFLIEVERSGYMVLPFRHTPG